MPSDRLRSPDEILTEGRRVLENESAAVAAMSGRLGGDFVEAVELLLRAPGRIIVSGIGKSGNIGRKIAATLTSTGSPATFLHPVEGLHGDLGIVSRDDVAILISKSGGTAELAGLMEFLARLGVPIIAMTGQVDSPLGRQAAVVLDCSVAEEACPMDLAPTTSTTATLALGDALAVVLLRQKGFQSGDFARIHPGGALGRKLTLRVSDVMIRDEYPQIGVQALVRDSIVPLAEMRGTVPIVDDSGGLLGVFTAGDLTRLMERREDFLEVPIREVMTPTPRVAHSDELGAAAVHRMETYGVMALPVVDPDGRLEGMVHLHDLMRAGAV
jgi:arabinose-5-phosphate isomerase